MNCDMNCSCCKRRIKSTAVAIAGGITTITVATLPTETCGVYCIDLLSAFNPCDTGCTQIDVTDGTTTLTIHMQNANFWRPCELHCHDKLIVKYYDDPVHLLLCHQRKRCHC